MYIYNDAFLELDMYTFIEILRLEFSVDDNHEWILFSPHIEDSVDHKVLLR
jgi:hypothetical protein